MGPGMPLSVRRPVGRRVGSSPSRRAMSWPSSYRLTASAPATWWTPAYREAASSRSPAARSATWTAHRTSSVNSTPPPCPDASSCTRSSCGELPSPMIRDVLAIAAPGEIALTAVSAAAFAAPYGLMGSGGLCSSYRSAAPEKSASLETWTSRRPAPRPERHGRRRRPCSPNPLGGMLCGPRHVAGAFRSGRRHHPGRGCRLGASRSPGVPPVASDRSQ